jgi:hypothetical protein
LKKVIAYLVIGFIALGLLCVRAAYSSRGEFLKAKSEASEGNVEEAILHFDRSLHWYAPGNPYSRKALAELWSIAKRQEKENPKMALLAADAARGGLRAIRSFYQPYSEWVLRVDEEIAFLRSREQIWLHPEQRMDQVIEWHRKILLRDERPKPIWVFWVQIGFWGWVASTVALIFRGFDSQGTMHLRPSLKWMLLMTLFFSIWIAGLVNA